MADSKQLLQAISYFQKYPVYEKLFSLMKQKYARLGHFGGTFVLDSLTDSDRGTLSGFLGMDIADMEPVKILFTRLNAALGKSRFAALSWEDILTKYYGMPLLVNRDVHLQRQQEKEAFFQACLSDCKDPDIRNWLAEVLLEQKSGCRIIEKQFANVSPHRTKVQSAPCHSPLTKNTTRRFKHCLALPFRFPPRGI